MVNKAVYCKKCGFVSTECDVKNDICPICSNKLYKTTEGAGNFSNRIEKSMPTWEDVVRHKYLRNITLDKEKSSKRSDIEQKKQQEEFKKLKNNPNQIEQDKFIPECPTCHSKKVKPISGIERGASIIGLGIFSKKINKSYKCKHCGYTW